MDPWYADGLRFACTGCGNCCRNDGAYAFVNLGARELEEIPRFLGLSREAFLERFCEKQPGRFPTLRMDQPRCAFLTDDSRCAIYPVRPMQCRTWPFWRANLEPEAWARVAATRCPGIGRGELWTREQIEAAADATEDHFSGPAQRP